MEQVHAISGMLAFTSALLSAKWAMELGASQARQALWGIAGLLLGPLALLLLCVRLVRARKSIGEPGGEWLSSRPAPKAIRTRGEILAIGHKA